MQWRKCLNKKKRPDWVAKTLDYIGPRGDKVTSFKKKHICLERELDTGKVFTIPKEEIGYDVLIVTGQDQLPYSMLKRYDEDLDHAFIFAKLEKLIYNLCQKYELLRDVVPEYFIDCEIIILGKKTLQCGIEKYIVIPFGRLTYCKTDKRKSSEYLVHVI